MAIKAYDALPSDDTTLQVDELDKLPKAAGVVISPCLCISKCL